jgi:hypothetical protein
MIGIRTTEDFNHPLTLGAAIVVGGILIHYTVARILAARRGVELHPLLATERR